MAGFGPGSAVGAAGGMELPGMNNQPALVVLLVGQLEKRGIQAHDAQAEVVLLEHPGEVARKHAELDVSRPEFGFLPPLAVAGKHRVDDLAVVAPRVGPEILANLRISGPLLQHLDRCLLGIGAS